MFQIGQIGGYVHKTIRFCLRRQRKLQYCQLNQENPPEFKQQRILAAFDFDLTITAEDTDTAVGKLLPREQLNSELLGLIQRCGWITYIRQVVKQLQQQQICAPQIGACVRLIQPVTGMMWLLRQLASAKHPLVDLCIISDANCFFINEWLQARQLQHLFMSVHTNGARVSDDGELIIEPYEQQTTCQHCPANLCKGKLLQQLRSEDYKRVIYVGDSCNDLCPILQLNETDVACVRRGLQLYYELPNFRECIKAQLLHWKDGFELHEQLLKLQATH